MCLGQGTARGPSRVGATRRLRAFEQKVLFSRKTSPADTPPSHSFPFPPPPPPPPLCLTTDRFPEHLRSQTASQKARIPAASPLTPPNRPSPLCSHNHSGLGSRRGAELISPKGAGQSRGGPRDTAPLSWRLWRWPSWAAGCGSRGCGPRGAGRGRCCRPTPRHTAAGPGWAASGDNSLYRTHCHSSWRWIPQKEVSVLFVFYNILCCVFFNSRN